MNYERLAQEADRPRKIRDHSAKWSTLQPVATVNGYRRERVEAFCRSRGITLEGLVALEARLAVRNGNRVELAFAGRNAGGAVTAIKYRPLDGSSSDTRAEQPSTWLRPIVVGKRDSLDWFVAEGETDGARLVDLVGDVAAVLVLPAGADTFRPEWADTIPRGATVYLCHDADAAGDAGATKAARVLGGRTVRVRPPVDEHDWCDLADVVARDEFVELVAAAKNGNDRPFAKPLDEFIAQATETPLVLVGDEQETIVPGAGLAILFARGGKGKTTLTIDAAFHFASGVDWLGFKVPRPLRVLLIENEGPQEPFRAKLALKRQLWPHTLTGAIHVADFDWGAITLKSGDQVARLRDYILAHDIDLAVGDPLDSLGLEGVGSPEDTREFMRLLGETGLFRDVAWWLLAHARKESAADELDEISGAWGGKPDSLLMLDKRDGNRARLSFPKIRWSRRGTRPAYILAFDPDTETFTVAHEEEAEERNYLTEVEQLLADGKWRTPKEIAAPQKSNGIGANVDTVKDVLAQHPDTFVSRNGKHVGRSALSTVWQLTQTLESVESVNDSTGQKDGTDSTDFPYKGSQLVESVQSPQLGTDSHADSAESVTGEDA